MKADSIKAALLAAMAIPVAATAADFYYKCDGDSGMFESPANWYVGNVVQAVYPGEEDAICCTTGLKTVRFETPGTTHRVARVSLDKTGKINNQRLFVDLNGGDLYVTDVVKMRASRYEGVVQPYLGVTNGTLHAESGIICGGDDNNYRGAFDAFGQDTHVVIGTGNLSANGAYSEINIGGGASARWEGKGYVNLANGQGSSYETEATIAKINVTGAGTTLECTNGFRVCNNARLRVADKAVVNISGFSTLGQYGRQDRNPIGVDIGGTTSGAAIEVDNATFSITNGANVMLAESDRSSLFNHSITVKNDGTFNYSGSTAFYLAYIASHASGVYKPATNNCLRVYSGARFSSDGNDAASYDEYSDIGAITVAGLGNCYDNGIHVSNGVVSVNRITLGVSSMSSNNWLRIEGRSARVLLNPKKAALGNMKTNPRNPALGLHRNSRVEFVLGPDGFDNTPIELAPTASGVYGTVYGQQGEGQKAQIIVEDQGFARNHANETITLIKTLNAYSREFLEQLAEDAVVVAARDSHKGSFSVSEDGTSLLYTAPRKHGAMLIFR